MVQIAVLANHENGRDSHIRQIKVYGPRPDPAGDNVVSCPGSISTCSVAMVSFIVRDVGLARAPDGCPHNVGVAQRGQCYLDAMAVDSFPQILKA